MDVIDLLEQGHESTARILAGVRTDQLGLPTPCSEWDVRALINHIIGGAHFWAAVGETGNPPAGAGGETPDFTGGDMQSNYEQAIKADLAAWRSPGSLERMCHLPFGEMPGQFAVGLHFVDNLIHGWDLATATGQDATLDPALATAAIDAVTPAMNDDIRGGPGSGAPFGPAVAVGEDAPPHVKLAALLGRQP